MKFFYLFKGKNKVYGKSFLGRKEDSPLNHDRYYREALVKKVEDGHGMGSRNVLCILS